MPELPDLVARPLVFTGAALRHVAVRAQVIDLLPLARAATWVTGELGDDGHSVKDQQTIGFNGDAGDPRGHVREEVVALEDGSSLPAIRTHPHWVGRGTIKGFLAPVALPAGAMFRAEVGFLAGVGDTDGVRFQVWVKSAGVGTRVVDLPKRSDGALVMVTADLSWLAGQSVELELRVDAGASSGQDWAVWTRPRIEVREGRAAEVRRFRVESLTIDRVAGAGDFNDPGLAALHFRAVIGHRGSSKVSAVECTPLGDDVAVGETIEIPVERGLFVDDPGVVWLGGDASQLSSQTAGRDSLYVCGVALAAIDRDDFGDDAVQDALHGSGNKLLAALRQHVETLTVADVIAQPARVEAAIAAVKQAVEGGDSGILSTIATVFVDLFTLGGPHDKVGVDKMAFLGVDSALITLFPVPAEEVGPLEPLPRRNTFNFRHKVSIPGTTSFGPGGGSGGSPPMNVDVAWSAVLVIETPTTPLVLGPGLAG